MQKHTQKCARRRSGMLRVAIASLGLIFSTTGPVRADLQVVPSLSVSERYDSNVLFTTARNNEDFITSVSTSISATYNGRPLQATLTGGGSLSTYAKHSDLNYGSATEALTLELTPLVGRIDQRARLQLAERVLYTPELPAFIAPSADSNPFATGIQPQRVRTFSYILSATGGYSLTTRVDLTAGYSYSFLNFGSTVGAPAQTSLFRTLSQAANAGPEIKLTPVDVLSLQYLYQNVDFNGGAVQGFRTQGGNVGLTHTFSPQLSGSIAAGATLITPSDRVAPLFRLTASWSERNTTASIVFTRSVTPSFTIAATALESYLVGLSVSHKLTGRLTAGIGVNYARSSSATSLTTGTSGTPQSDLSFESYGADLSLNYTILRWLSASFSYSHSRFSQGFSNSTSIFDRDVVSLSVSASWL